MAAGTQIDKGAPGPDSGRAVGTVATGRLTTTAAGLGPVGYYWQQFSGVWNSLGPRQRSWTTIGAALLVATVISLIWFATKTDWRTLYAGLDPEDTRQMGLALTQAQIPFDVSADGSSVQVPAGYIDKARLATAAKGGPRSGRMGFELFDKPNWVGSEFDERVNYQRALEGELEHTVATLSDVQSARVHLVMPHDSLFRDQERPAKAAVVLTLRHRTLASGEDEAIRNLVAAAVDGLVPAGVSLIDASGNQPLGPKKGDELRLGVEQGLEAKLIETLEAVTGVGNVRASVTVDYDPAASDLTEETYDPDQSATLSMQRTEQSTGPQPVAAGVPGTATNAPNSQAAPVYPQQSMPPQTAKTESGTYGVSRKVKHITQGPGHIRRLTAAILVNDRMTPSGGKGKAATWSPRSAEELRTLTSLAQAAVGFDTTRGDTISVQDLAFDQNRNQGSTNLVKQSLATVESSPLIVKYVTLLAGLILLIFFGIRPALQKASAFGGAVQKTKGRQLTGAGTSNEVLPMGGQLSLDQERQRAQQVFEQVSNQLKREPAQSSKLLQSWIQSE